MRLVVTALLLASAVLTAQTPDPSPAANGPKLPDATAQAAPADGADASGWKKADAPPARGVRVEPGTRIPLTLINTVSSRSATNGDRVYLETAFPVIVNGKIVIPAGSYVAGTVMQVKRAGRVKGKGEIYVRFDSLTLPNGVTRDFRATISQVDDVSSQKLDKQEGKVTAEGNKGGDLKTIGEAAGAGASVGSIAGAVGGNAGKGLGIGAAAGAAAGLIGVMVTRGPEAVLAKGTTIEMVLDRPVQFEPGEVDFNNTTNGARHSISAPAPASKSNSSSVPMTGRRFPL